MQVFAKPKIERDIFRVRKVQVLEALYSKLGQPERAETIDKVPGVKLLRGYSTHFHIIVKSGEAGYRIGAIIRGDTIWLVRFLSTELFTRCFHDTIEFNQSNAQELFQ